MIPILYEHNEYLFNTFGIGPLAEASSCEVTEERNGGYEFRSTDSSLFTHSIFLMTYLE